MSEEKQEGDFKIKKSKPKMKQLNKEEGITKVNISKPVVDEVKPEEITKVVIPSESKTEDDAIQIGETTEVLVGESSGDSEKMGEEIQKPVEEEVSTEQPTLQEITEDVVEEVAKEVKEAKRDAKITGKPLPENIEKLVSFMEDTGGNIEDYVRLNADYSNVDNDTLLREYYRQTKPHLDNEEIAFLMEDNFSYDEELEEERDIRKKKLAIKEEVAKAKNFLESSKSKYYDEIKLRPGVTQEQQKAIDFFNRYTEDQSNLQEQREDFKQKTNEYFNHDFKGFDFNLGDKKFRYKVQNPSKTADNQSSLQNLVGKFFDGKGNINDSKGYHKAIYAAENVDVIANHFYEQGKADAVRDVVSNSKNPSTELRQASQSEGFKNGIKAKVLGNPMNDSSKLKIKKIKI